MLISHRNTLTDTPRIMFNLSGEEQTFLCPQGSSGWSNNQIDMRQSSKRKTIKFSYIHMYGNPIYMSGSETEKEIEVYMTF